jgi:SAM-dependent methyltransferase
LVSEVRTVSGLLLEQVDSNKLASAILKHAGESKNEEDLKIRVEDELREILKQWGIEWASYEHRLKISGREDSLYGTVIIEYKTPGRLESKAEYSKTKEQIKDYIKQEAGAESKYGKYFGVVMDGYKIAFVRYRKNEWLEQAEPFEVNGQTILRLLESIRGLRRKPIDAEQLLLDFGPRSQISRKAIFVLYNALADKNTARTDMLFNDWRRVFSQVCSYSPDKLSGLVDFYGLKSDWKVDVEKLLFGIHTYYTILMKLLTSEIVTLFADSLLGSYLKRIEEAYYRSKDELLVELKDLEEGGIFSSLGIRNFLEADYFGWYLDEWNTEVATAIYEISKKLLDYEPATVELNPERVKDLFKRLYQNLVPRDIRHSIGEYFTPDWLADLLLDEVDYDGNPDKRVLDPACGSGTFIVLAIRRIREYAEEHFIDRREVLAKITSNVRGIDLNPLAVLASKANYLIALSDLLRYRPREGIDIPIFLADSISVVRRVTPYGEDEFELQTNEGKFWVTKEVIDNNVLQPVLSIISEGIKVNLTKHQFELSLSKGIPLRKESVQSLARLYDKILTLERYGKNRIWTSLLKNSFSPMLIGRFDFVVGNPPWINWENLPEFYRNSTKGLWNEYGLIGKGAFKKDISSLFVARCRTLYMREGGKLAFLIPFTTFKNPSGGGYRKFLVERCNVVKAHDLVELYPFEGAVNRTAMIVLTEGKSTFPIPCVMWKHPRSSGVEMESELLEIKKAIPRHEMILAPIVAERPESPWMIISKGALGAVRKALGASDYSAQEGVNTRGANAIYYLKLISKMQDRLVVKNDVEEGRARYRERQGLVESDLVYPLIRGAKVKKWYANPTDYILVPHDHRGKALSEDQLKVQYRETFKFLSEFRSELESRKFYGKKIKGNFPFYTLFQVNASTFSEYKVVWKSIAGKISGKPEFNCAVVSANQDRILGRKGAIPNESLVFIPLEQAEEAYYCCAILNSSIVKLIVASYTIETRIPPNITENVFIPRFDPHDKTHRKLSELSVSAHELARGSHKANQQNNDRVAAIESELDELVSATYGIKKEELAEIKRTLRLVMGS